MNRPYPVALLTYALIAVLVNSAVLASGSTENALSNDRGIVFSGDLANDLLDRAIEREPDSRSTWQPDSAQIASLETILAAELARRLSDVSDARLQVQDYYRQYAGFEFAGRKLIFINGFHASHVVRTTEWLKRRHSEHELEAFPAGWRNETFWHRVPVRVLDGGEYFFFAIYDPSQNRIIAFQFNGYA